MKTKLSLTKQNKKTRTEIQFVRVFSFYIDLAIGSKKAEAYFFKVTVSTQAPLNPQTGMTVDLVQLDRVAHQLFKNQKAHQTSKLSIFFQLKFKTLEKLLKKHKIHLVSVQFNECRGSSVLVTARGQEIIRQDLASDHKGCLYSVTSWFDQGEKLVQLRIKNLKTNLVELIIF